MDRYNNALIIQEGGTIIDILLFSNRDAMYNAMYEIDKTVCEQRYDNCNLYEAIGNAINGADFITTQNYEVLCI